MVIPGILGLIGFILIIAPFVGLAIDVRKNQQITVLLGFLGLSLLAIAGLQLFQDITNSTLYALSLAPLVFVYILVLKYFHKKKEEKDKLEEDDIIDDLDGKI